MATNSAWYHRLPAEDGADRDGRGRHRDPPVGQLRRHPDRRRRKERLQRGCKACRRLEFRGCRMGVKGVWDVGGFGMFEACVVIGYGRCGCFDVFGRNVLCFGRLR